MPVSCVVFVLLHSTVNAGAPQSQRRTFKFITFDAPAGTKLVPMPDLAFPTRAEAKLMADFILSVLLKDEKVNVHIICTLARSVALQNVSPVKMQSQIRLAMLSVGPVVSSRRFVLQKSGLPAELIGQNGGAKNVWTILASNRNMVLTITWGRPREKHQFVADVIRLANSLRFEEKDRALNRGN